MACHGPRAAGRPEPAGGDAASRRVGMDSGVKLGSEAAEEVAEAVEGWMLVGGTVELVGH